MESKGTEQREIENIEILYTDQGAFFFKLYSSGHSYETFPVWVKCFEYMIEKNLVPSIIIPQGHPNAILFTLLKTLIPPEYSGTLLTFK